jgi:hypothetical protein
MRRSLIMLALAASAALTTTAQAQTGPGTLYYRYGTNSPNDVYRVAGDGTGNVKIGPSPGVITTALATYPGGRQFIGSSVVLGPLPGVAGNYGDIVLYSELNATPTTVTNFRGPQYVDQNGIRVRISNDQRDSFLSFVVYDARTALWIYCRYNGPISDIFHPSFVPFVSDDPRLVPLMSATADYRARGFWSWDRTGTKLTFSDINATGNTLIYIYDATTNSSTLVNNPAVSGFNLTTPWGSSTEFRLFSPATHSNGTRGIVSFYPTTGQFSWVIKEGGNGSNYIDSFSPTAISPDGTTLAFGMRRMVGKYIRPSLVRVPANGGSYTALVTYTDSTTNSINAGGLGWRW